MAKSLYALVFFLPQGKNLCTADLKPLPVMETTEKVSGLTAASHAVVDNAGDQQATVQSIVDLNPWPQTGLEESISREYQVSQASWASTDARGVVLATLKFPDLLVAKPVLLDRLRQFRLLACDVKVRVDLNSPSMNGGSLILAYYPFYDSTASASNRHLTVNQLLSNPDTRIISASGGGSEELVIPWKANSPFCHVANIGGSEKAIVGTLFVVVLDPLIQPGNLTPVADITVYAQMINIRLAGYIPTHLGLDSAQSRKHEANERSKAGVISGIAEAVGEVAGTIASVAPIPALGEIAAGVKLAAGFARSLGLDQPVSLMAPAPFYQTQFAPHTKGLASTTVASFDPERTATKPDDLYVGEANPSLLALARRPGLAYSFDFNETTLGNAELLDLPVHPLVFMYETIGANYYACPTPLAAAARPFLYWRGTLRYSVKFYAPALTTAKVRIVIHPDGDPNPASIEDVAGDTISKIVDINGDTEVNFSVPFIYERLYSRVSAPANSDSSTYMYGQKGVGTIPTIVARDIPSRIGMYLLARVRAYNGDAVSIRAHVFVSAGEDFSLHKYIGYRGNTGLDVAQCSRGNSSLFAAGDFASFVPSKRYVDTGVVNGYQYLPHELARMPVMVAQSSVTNYAPVTAAPWVGSAYQARLWMHWFLGGFRGFRGALRVYYSVVSSSTTSLASAEVQSRVNFSTARNIGTTTTNQVLDRFPNHQIEFPYESVNIYELTSAFNLIEYCDPEPFSDWTTSSLAAAANAVVNVRQFMAAGDDLMLLDWFVPAPCRA